MTFDKCGRRLLTGGRDGSLKLWNFNNGECLRVLKNSYDAEVLTACRISITVPCMLHVYKKEHTPSPAFPKMLMSHIAYTD